MKSNKVPIVMCHPLWVGLKKRFAKKRRRGVFREWKFLKLMESVKVGDFVLTCSLFNAKIVSIDPVYRDIGRGGRLIDPEESEGVECHGNLLVDIDIETDGGGCSFYNCGVEPARSREDILKYWEKAVKDWNAVGDPWNFAKRYEFTTVDEYGRAIVDYKGYEEKYGKM